MKNLYEKSKIRFALTWIISYVIGASCADELSRLVNMEKSITVIFLGIMTAVALLWMKKNDLFREFGLCKAEISLKDCYTIFRLSSLHPAICGSALL